MIQMLNAKSDKKLNFDKDITFDYEGKIIKVKGPNVNNLPSTLENPKIKFK